MSFFSEEENVSFSMNGTQLYGWDAIIFAPIFSIIFSLILTLYFWIVLGIGLRIYSKFSTIKIKYFEKEEK